MKRAFMSIPNFILYLILLGLMVGFLPGLVSVNDKALDNLNAPSIGNASTTSPEFIALSLLPLILFACVLFLPIMNAVNGGGS
jgi:hypothetical protein